LVFYLKSAQLRFDRAYGYFGPIPIALKCEAPTAIGTTDKPLIRSLVTGVSFRLPTTLISPRQALPASVCGARDVFELLVERALRTSLAWLMVNRPPCRVP
jgi:hypothetical protein